MKEEILVFHYADRAKAFLLELFRIFDVYINLNKSKDLERLMLEIIKGCEKEIKLGMNICSGIPWAEKYFEESSEKIESCLENFNSKNYDMVKENIRDVLNRMTTCAAKAEEKLK